MAKKSNAPDNITEEYYQISPEILASFSKYRPPVDLFKYKADIKQLYALHRKGQRLNNDQIEEIVALCEVGELFVSRTDHPIYSEHIIKQVDLVLADVNLKEGEVADIFMRALEYRYENLIEQPVKPVFDLLYRDVLVFTEYIAQDKYRIGSFARRLYKAGFTAGKHAVNCLILGVWFFFQELGTKEFRRKTLDRTALAYLVHDLGMSKIPSYILDKQNSLKNEEKDKVLMHPLVTIKVMQKCNVVFDELVSITMQHHERLDGSGYPQRLKNEQISNLGRIAGIVDSVSAMIQYKSYGDRKDLGEAIQTLIQDKNKYDLYYLTMLNNAYLTNVFGSVS